MKKSKSVLILFLMGLVCERYIFPLIDIGVGLLSNKFSLSTSKTQKKINEITLASEYTQTNAIGFAHNGNEEYYDDDIEDKMKNKIGSN